ncbi:MAG: GH92 family glycosyl hydrolase [Planctomycetota bacterium]|jgi:predicted alpha-1,2-mannosidase
MKRLLFLLLLCGCEKAVKLPVPGPARDDVLAYVDPFIGTGGHGHTFPGATMPFGMVQLSPDTRMEGWDGCSGYHYSDKHIYGFSHTHLQGTGVSDYGDVLLMPGYGPAIYNNGADGKPGYRQAFSHERESAGPGTYEVVLDDTGIGVELTVTPRVGVHRYTFPKAGRAHVVIDLQHRDTVIASTIGFAEREVTGMRRSRAWAQDQHIYFVMRFSKPFASSAEAEEPGDKGVRGHVEFDVDAGERIEVQVGISAVDEAGARRNLEAEAAGKGFDELRAAARAAWREELSRIIVSGGTKAQRRTFATALYHSFVAPNLFMDVDGRYRGTDLKVHTADGWTHHTVFSLWDTFRATHPLFTIVQRERTADFVKTMLAQYVDGGQLPVWELAGTYTGCMIGYHSVSVIADAYAKGIRGFDAEQALEAMVHSARLEKLGLPAYREFGFIPSELEGESVSKTLEYAYDDWCIAVTAQALGNREIADAFFRRALSYRNVYDPSSGFMRPKRNQQFIEPFAPEEVNSHFTEANSWQYSLFVPHDVAGLMELLGGPEELETWLDQLFDASSETSGREQADITGLIGQYAHGNEPSHHMAYLYAFSGRPDKTQATVREILDTLYSDKPDGLCGNEDCGQMSSWYVFSALGFYPVTPGTKEYVIGAPLFPEATIRLENGKTFNVRSTGSGPYVQAATLNGKPHARAVLSHDAILAGGELVFEMGGKPSEWGRKDPPSTVVDAVIVTVPFVEGAERAFRESTTVRLRPVEMTHSVQYSLDGGETFQQYTGPFTLTETTEVVAYAEGLHGKSANVRARFLKTPHDWRLALGSEYANQYAATGDQALIDGLRGGADWRTGDWQGFHEVDLDLVIDLGAVKAVKSVMGSFLQDQRSWIWLPREVVVSTSVDGEQFKEFGRAEPGLDEKHGETARKLLGATGSVRARYVRVAAKSMGRCPDWHPGAGDPAWIFCDEILVDAAE